MKKIFVAVALVMGLGTTVAFVENLTSGVETVMAVNDFTPIEVKDLPAAVTEAIAKNFAESTVKEAAVEAAEDGSKTYQVVLTDKEGAESTVFFNEKGEILIADPGDKQLSSLPSFFIKQHEESRRGLRHSSTLITWKLASGPAPAVLHGRLSQRALVKGFPAPEPQKLFFRALPVF